MTSQIDARECAFCAKPIPNERSQQAIYCHRNCGRKASYHRKSPEGRREINKRSNDRRFKQDLLPIIRGLSKFPEEIPNGHPVAQWTVLMILMKAPRCWKHSLAMNFAALRKVLAEKAGGPDALLALEDMAAEITARSIEQQKVTP